MLLEIRTGKGGSIIMLIFICVYSEPQLTLDPKDLVKSYRIFLEYFFLGSYSNFLYKNLGTTDNKRSL